MSHYVREIAAAQLYRRLTHKFSDYDERPGHQPVDRLAGTLETLVTSDYNYAKYIREIKIDTVYGGESGERACKEYSYEYSCGKFLNTLLLTTLKNILLRVHERSSKCQRMGISL